jgi:hypothetical protein
VKVKRTIVWRLTETQKELILRAVLHCPCEIGEGATEHEEHHAQLRKSEEELAKLGWGGEGLWNFLNHNTKRLARR